MERFPAQGHPEPLPFESWVLLEPLDFVQASVFDPGAAPDLAFVPDFHLASAGTLYPAAEASRSYPAHPLRFELQGLD